MNIDFEKLEKILSCKFNNKDLYLQAFTHSSYANEEYGDTSKSNERLEFLGDAVLDLIASDIFFAMDTSGMEGDLTKLRAFVVCEKALAEINRKYKFTEFLMLGHGEEMAGGRNRDSIAADCVEAIIGALYLDLGYAKTFEIIKPLLMDSVNKALEGNFYRDAKTVLQEKLQADKVQIEYRMLSEQGPAHDKTFVFAVYADKKKIGVGTGKSKKEAQTKAAEAALKGL